MAVSFSTRLTLSKTSDLRMKTPPVSDQGSVGKCAGATGCEMMEFLEGKGQNDDRFSDLYVYGKARIVDGTPLSDDSGTEMRSVMKSLANFGVCYEKTWPSVDDGVAFSKTPSAEAEAEAAQHKALFYYRCSSLLTIKASLCQGFPVGFGFSVPTNMMSDECAKSGIVHLPKGTEGFEGGHAVTAVGHDDSMMIDGAPGALLVQNHWGIDWGIGGFFWLPYGFVTLALADDFWTLRRAQV